MLGLKALRDQVECLVDDLRTPALADDLLDQAATAWVLGAVLVRFTADNGLIPRRHGRLRDAFTHLGTLPATAPLVDERNPVWRFTISERAETALWDRLGTVSFASADLDTRFLGDLYQNLSPYARHRYALLQTPGFVESLILDRTLEPARRELGADRISVIDPACGAGHFLVGAFHRLRAHRPQAPAQEILDQITGVDVNPFAVALAHFRLSVAALHATGGRDLAGAP
ncbi:MAG: DNA methyltransferase, partial [Actinoplanes sp.]